MIFSCPQCHVRLGLPPETAGKSVRCSKCGHVFKVPRAADDIPTVEPVRETGIAAAPAQPVHRKTPITTETAKPADVTIPKYLRLLALLPVGIIILANTTALGGGGLIRGAIWGGFGGMLAGACLWIAQRTRWPLAIRSCSMLSIAIVGYGVLIGVSVAPKLVVALGGGWSEFSPPGGGYHVSMPGTPTLQPNPANVLGNAQIYLLDLKALDLAYFVSTAEVTAEEWKRMPLGNRFEGARDGMFLNTPGATVTAQKRIGLNGIPGREYLLDVTGQGKMIGRVYCANRRVYTLLVGGSKVRPDSDEARKFFDSFRVDPPDADHQVMPEDQPPDWDEEDTIPERTILAYLWEDGDSISQVAFTSDSKKLIAASWRKGLVVWDIEARQIERTLRTPPRQTVADPNIVGLRFAVSPDGTTVAVSVLGERAATELYDLATGQKRCELIDGLVNAGQLWVYGLTFSADSRWLAAAYSDGVRIWDVAGQKVARRMLRKETGAPLAFTPDGRSLVCSGRDRVLFLDPFSGGEQRSFRLPRPKDPLFPDAVSLLAISADGQRLVTGGFRGGLRLWDVATGTPQVLRDQGQPVTALDIWSNGKLFVVGEQQGNVSVYDATGKERWHKLFPQMGLARGVAVAFSVDGQQLALAHSRRLEIWDVERLVQATPEELKPANSVAAADVPPAENGARKIPGFQAHQAIDRNSWVGIAGLMVSPDDSKLITVSMNKSARAWSLATGEPLGEPLDLSGHPKIASIRPDGRAFAIATQDAFNHKEEIYLRDIDPADWQNPLAALAKEGPGSRRLKNKGYLFAALAADGKTLAVADQGKCTLLNWSDLSVRVAFPRSGSGIHFLSVSPDGNTVAAAGTQDPQVHLFDALIGKERQKFEAHRNGVRALAYSPDGKRLAAILANNRIATWELEGGKVTEVVFRNVPANIPMSDGCLAFSSDSTLLAASGMGETGEWKAVLYDAATCKELTTFTYPSITALAFTHDGRTLIGGGGDGYVNLWPIGAFRK